MSNRCLQLANRHASQSRGHTLSLSRGPGNLCDILGKLQDVISAAEMKGGARPLGMVAGRPTCHLNSGFLAVRQALPAVTRRPGRGARVRYWGLFVPFSQNKRFQAHEVKIKRYIPFIVFPRSAFLPSFKRGRGDG